MTSSELTLGWTSMYVCLVYFLKSRLIPFPGQRSKDATKPGFSFLCVMVYFVTDACLLLLC